MRSISTNNQLAVAEARTKGIVPRGFFWITVKHLETGEPESFGLWTGDDTLLVDVMNGITGLIETRDYVGGVNLQIGDIPRVSDLTIQTNEVKFSAIADITQQIIRGYDARLAKVEIHTGWLDTVSRGIVDLPEVDFLGEVNGAPIETSAAGGESLITLNIRSDAIAMLTRTNPSKRSYEGQKRRGGDEFGLYSNSVKTWKIFWGENEVGGDK
ncbi:MAG: hypothetical protein ACRC9K_12155 [Afipia sp.]